MKQLAAVDSGDLVRALKLEEEEQIAKSKQKAALAREREARRGSKKGSGKDEQAAEGDEEEEEGEDEEDEDSLSEDETEQSARKSKSSKGASISPPSFFCVSLPFVAAAQAETPVWRDLTILLNEHRYGGFFLNLWFGFLPPSVSSLLNLSKVCLKLC